MPFLQSGECNRSWTPALPCLQSLSRGLPCPFCLFWSRKASMSSYASSPSCLSFSQALAPFYHDEGLPFAQVLPAAVVDQAFADEDIDFGATKKSVFTPAVTLWAFLSQVSEDDKSCRAAVSRVL